MRFDLAIECITKKYAVFEGRASRAEYWTYILVLTVFGILVLTVFGLVVGVIIGSAEPTLLPLFQIIGFLCFFLPGLALSVRRLNVWRARQDSNL